ncbi:MAG: hypothetical protein ACWA5Q_07980 [bacterium]
MDANSIELKGSMIQGVRQEGESVIIRFEPAYIIRTMTGSQERTKWWQNCELVFDEVVAADGLDLGLPAACEGGDVSENVYTYRDMVPIPLESRGRAGCALSISGNDQKILVTAAAVKLVTEEVPKYIEHIRAES